MNMEMTTTLTIKYVFYAVILIQIVSFVVLLLQLTLHNANNVIQVQLMFIEN